MKLGNRQNAELNVENTGLGFLRYCLDRGDGCSKLMLTSVTVYHRYYVTSHET